MTWGWVGWTAIARVRPPMFPGPSHVQPDGLIPAVKAWIVDGVAPGATGAARRSGPTGMPATRYGTPMAGFATAAAMEHDVRGLGQRRHLLPHRVDPRDRAGQGVGRDRPLRVDLGAEPVEPRRRARVVGPRLLARLAPPLRSGVVARRRAAGPTAPRGEHDAGRDSQDNQGVHRSAEPRHGSDLQGGPSRSEGTSADDRSRGAARQVKKRSEIKFPLSEPPLMALSARVPVTRAPSGPPRRAGGAPRRWRSTRRWPG